MPGSEFGTLFHVSTFGESHGCGLGVVIDGCPAGLSLSVDDIMPYMRRRKPGQGAFTTARNEGDEVEILSGVFEEKTLGTPIALLVRNKDQHSSDYGNIKDIYRPGHADMTFDKKYGIRDYRGGGRSSGRETLARVAAGAVAAKLLSEFGIDVISFTRSIGEVEIDERYLNPLENKVSRDKVMQSPLYMPDEDASAKAMKLIGEYRRNKDSVGGVVEIHATGLPVGLGETVFEKIDARLSAALFSVGAVKAVEIGDGIKSSFYAGSENNDGMTNLFGDISKTSNHAGGCLGGMTDGSMLVARAYFKPTPSIAQTQLTVDKNGNDVSINIKGRHDPVIVPRAVVVTEAMADLVLADLLMQNAVSRLDNLKKIYTEQGE